jgi:hypothetical protein
MLIFRYDDLDVIVLMRRREITSNVSIIKRCGIHRGKVKNQLRARHPLLRQYRLSTLFSYLGGPFLIYTSFVVGGLVGLDGWTMTSRLNSIVS